MSESFIDRVSIEKKGDSFEIRISPEKNYFLIIFISIWLCGWFAGVIIMAFHLLENSIVQSQLMGWFLALILGGVSSILTLLWYFLGSEVISVSQGGFSIQTEIFGIGPTRRFEISKIRYMRLNLSIDQSHSDFFMYGKVIKSKEGAIKFDYDKKLVKFGVSVNDQEALKLIDVFKNNVNFRNVKF